MKLKIINDSKKWNEYVFNNNGTIFHSYEWGMLMERLQNVIFYPVFLEDGDKKILIQVFEQNKKISSSLLGYGGPIIVGEKKIDFDIVQQEIFSYFGMYITNLLMPYNFDPFILYDYALWQEKHTYLLSLPESYGEIWDNSSGKARTGVRYSIKHGVEIKEIARSELDKFYKLYIEHTTVIGGSYIISYQLFDECKKKLNQNSMFLGAYKEGQLISSSVFLFDNHTMYYWININSNLGRKLQASYQLMDFALKIAVNKHLKLMDFGFSHSKEVARPKIYWGAEVEYCLCLKGGS